MILIDSQWVPTGFLIGSGWFPIGSGWFKFYKTQILDNNVFHIKLFFLVEPHGFPVPYFWFLFTCYFEASLILDPFLFLFCLYVAVFFFTFSIDCV